MRHVFISHAPSAPIQIEQFNSKRDPLRMQLQFNNTIDNKVKIVCVYVLSFVFISHIFK